MLNERVEYAEDALRELKLTMSGNRTSNVSCGLVKFGGERVLGCGRAPETNREGFYQFFYQSGESVSSTVSLCTPCAAYYHRPEFEDAAFHNRNLAADESLFDAPGDAEKIRAKASARFCVIGIDETRDWQIPDYWESWIDKILSVYVYDETVLYHLMGFDSNYRLKFLDFTVVFREEYAADDALEAEREEIRAWVESELANQPEERYFTVAQIEALVRGFELEKEKFRFHRFAEEVWNPEEQTYADIWEGIYEHCRGNAYV